MKGQMREGLHLYGWLGQIKDIVPPLCVELFLNDQRSYFLNSVVVWDDNDPFVVIRIWDFREFNDEDLEKLREKMNAISSREQYANLTNVHPKLDVANMRLNKNMIAYIIEWHDKLWSLEEKKGVVGFQRPQK